MKKSAEPKRVLGQKSWRLKSDCVDAYVTRRGGHLGPVTFDRAERAIKPYSVAPWAEEKLPKDVPAILKVLRGDFFCLPFGGNDTVYRGEDHPVHGEVANAKWSFEELTKEENRALLHLSLKTKVRPGRVDKRIGLIYGHNAVYCQHTVSEMKGSMTCGHHAMLKFPDREGSGIITTSPFAYGQTFVEPTEKPEEKGYSCLKPGAEFKTLRSVPTVFGRKTDLSRYPARRGYEDIAMIVADPEFDLAWTAVTFPDEGYVWLSLKDPTVLRNTVFWLSNGGRHYPPWNGRHVNVMGLEDVTAYFHYGLAESVRKNPLSEQGLPTRIRLKQDNPFTVNYIMAVVPITGDFDEVKSVDPVDTGQLRLTAKNGAEVVAPIHVDFLKTGDFAPAG